MSSTKPIDQVVNEIIARNTKIAEFWTNPYGWAPKDAADLLSKSRLDWQVSLSHCLKVWLRKPKADRDEGSLILAWANLGALVEGSMKFFLSVYLHDYDKGPHLKWHHKTKTQVRTAPEKLMLEMLRQFFARPDGPLTENQRGEWLPFIELVQQRRNAIHAYQNRAIGNWTEWREAVRRYRIFIDVMDNVPYPDSYHG